MVQHSGSSLLLMSVSGLGFGDSAIEEPNSPEFVDYTIQIPAGDLCAFNLEMSVNGKAKTISLSGDRFIFTSPGLDVVLQISMNPLKR
jgi:hypothetical protein